jgi:phage gpG-like protein
MSIRALLQGGRTMTDTGRLAASITHEADEAGVAIGTNVAYGAIHQTGGTITAKTSSGLRFRVGGQWVTKQSVTIPARPFLGIDEDDEKEIEAISARFLAAAFGEEGNGAGGRNAD